MNALTEKSLWVTLRASGFRVLFDMTSRTIDELGTIDEVKRTLQCFTEV